MLKDSNQTAVMIARLINGEKQGKNPAAVALGRLGGLKGGRARAESLSDSERKEIAKKAANARWSGKNKS